MTLDPLPRGDVQPALPSAMSLSKRDHMFEIRVACELRGKPGPVAHRRGHCTLPAVRSIPGSVSSADLSLSIHISPDSRGNPNASAIREEPPHLVIFAYAELSTSRAPRVDPASRCRQRECPIRVDGGFAPATGPAGPQRAWRPWANCVLPSIHTPAIAPARRRWRRSSAR